MHLLDLVWRQWRQRPTRTILSALSVAIAVAAVLGTAVSQSSVRSGSENLREFIEGPPTLDIVAAVPPAPPTPLPADAPPVLPANPPAARPAESPATAGGRLSPDSLPKLDDIPGVTGSFSIVSRATLTRAHGKRIKSIVVGLPLDRPAAWQALPLTEGRKCQAEDEAVMAADIAKQYEVKLGDQVTLLTRRGPKLATIVGLADARPLSSLAPGASVALPLETVDRAFNLDGAVDQVRLQLKSPDDRTSVEATLRQRLPDGLTVQTSGPPAELADTVLKSTELALKFSGALSLAMATFIILNTLRMNFAERRREVAVMRVLGATGPQLVMLHLIEGAALGAIGALAGIPLGLALGRWMTIAMQRLLQAPIGVSQVSAKTITTALVAGPLVAALAAIVPALQSRRVSPREAMSGAEPHRSEGLPRWATVSGAIAMALAVTLMLLVMSRRLHPEMAIPAGVSMLLAFIVIIPAVIGPVSRVASRVIGAWWPLSADLATAQLLERRIRTGLTAGVLVVAVNACLGLGNSIINNVDDVQDWHRRWLTGEVSLVDPTFREFSGGDEERSAVRDEVLQHPGVKSVVELRFLPARADGVAATCIVRDFLSGEALPWTLTAGNVEKCGENLRDGETVIGSVLAQKLRLAVGDQLRVEIGGRTLRIRIAALANDYMLGGMVVYLDRAAAAKQINIGPASIWIAHATPGKPADELLQELRPVADKWRLVPRSFVESRERLDRLIHGIVGALWGLLVVGFVVGCAAVANSLTMNVLEQTAELGLLRIIGMTRAQVRAVVLCESLLLGILGAGLGTLAGLVTAGIIQLCNEPLLGHPVEFRFHPLLLAANAGGCLLVALIAGWSPGARAARLDLTAAIAYE